MELALGMQARLRQAGDGHLPDENDIRASYAPAGKHSRA
jgi:hypothetical protein